MSENEEKKQDDILDDELEQALEESGAELDALLDEIGTEEDEPLQQEAEEEPVVGAEEGNDGFDELVELPEVDDELDLSGGEADGVPVIDEPEDAVPQTEQAATDSMEKNMNTDPLAEVAAIAAERNAEVAKSQGIVRGMGMQIALGSISLLALITAGFAAWQAYAASSRVEALAMTVQTLQQRKAPAGKPVDAGSSALRGDLDKLMAQVNEMAATLDGSLVELRDQNSKALADFGDRLDKLETSAKTKTVPAKTEAETRAMVEKAPTVAGTSSGGWSVNLISLSSEKDADEELAHLRNLGIRAEKHRVEQDGRVWFRLRVPGFTSRDGARAYIETVEDKAGVSNAWIGKD